MLTELFRELINVAILCRLCAASVLPAEARVGFLKAFGDELFHPAAVKFLHTVEDQVRIKNLGSTFSKVTYEYFSISVSQSFRS